MLRRCTALNGVLSNSCAKSSEVAQALGTVLMPQVDVDVRQQKIPPPCSLGWPRIKLLALAPLARPAPELALNVNDVELGDLGLSDKEETDLVAFLKTLTDDYPTWGKDPRIPMGTPSPFIGTPFPPLP